MSAPHSLFHENPTDLQRALEAAGLRDPLSWLASDGAGTGPWFDCGPARRTGEVYARTLPGGLTQLFWGPAMGLWAATVGGEPDEGALVEIGGFGWVVRWPANQAAVAEAA